MASPADGYDSCPRPGDRVDHAAGATRSHSRIRAADVRDAGCREAVPRPYGPLPGPARAGRGGLLVDAGVTSIGLLTRGKKESGERSARNSHASFDAAGAGNEAWSRSCDYSDTERARKKERPTPARQSLDPTLKRGPELNAFKPNLGISIQTLLQTGKAQREIARVTGVDRKTVRRGGSCARSSYECKSVGMEKPGWRNLNLTLHTTDPLWNLRKICPRMRGTNRLNVLE